MWALLPTAYQRMLSGYRLFGCTIRKGPARRHLEINLEIISFFE